MRLVIIFVIVYLFFWCSQNVLTILLDWLRHFVEYRSAKMSLDIAEREELLKQKISGSEESEDANTDRQVGFQYFVGPEEEEIETPEEEVPGENC